jgi:hypothetical protein
MMAAFRVRKTGKGPGMTDPVIANGGPALEEAARELQAARHDAQVAYDCIALGDLDRAHTNTLTARVALDAAVTALTAVLPETDSSPGL